MNAEYGLVRKKHTENRKYCTQNMAYYERNTKKYKQYCTQNMACFESNTQKLKNTVHSLIRKQ